MKKTRNYQNEKRRCVKMHISFFLRTKPRLSQAGALLLPKDFVSLSIQLYYDKDTFSSLQSQPNSAFPQRIDEDIAENDPVRMVDAPVESLNLEKVSRKLYRNAVAALTIPR